MNPNSGRAKVKLTIAKLFEIAYSTDKGVTTALIQKKGTFAFRIDNSENVTIIR